MVKLYISLFFVSVMVVDADEGASEGEYLAKGDEYRVVDLSQRRATEARYEHYASEDAQCHCSGDLQASHSVTRCKRSTLDGRRTGRRTCTAIVRLCKQLGLP